MATHLTLIIIQKCYHAGLAQVDKSLCPTLEQLENMYILFAKLEGANFDILLLRTSVIKLNNQAAFFTLYRTN